MPYYDVLIAGYGPTGAVAANLLGQQGVRVLVVEPSSEIFDIPRAVHFDGEVMRIFQSLGLAEPIEQVSAPGTALGFTNGRNWNLLMQDLTQIPRHHGWANSYFFNQPALEQHLRAGADRFSCVDVCLGETVTGFAQTADEVLVRIGGARPDQATSREVRAKFLLGCDGASSRVRRGLNIAQEDLDCDEPWLVCDWILPPDTPIDRRAYQICDPNRPTTLVPCEGEHIRWEFMVNPADSAEMLEDEVHVRQMMAPHLHWLSPDLKPDTGQLVRAKVYTFHALIAETFQQNRVFLLGDAAHQTPPFLGQGMCAGIRDAHNLCWKLAGVLKGDYSSRLLASYTTERRPHVYEVIKTAVRHGGVIQNRSHVLAFLRDCYLKLGTLLPVFVKFLRFDLSWSLGDGLFVKEDIDDELSPVARPFPQYARSDDCLGEGFTLVGLDQGVPKMVNVSQPKIDCLTIDALTPDTLAAKQLNDWFATHKAVAALLRPDRHVYGYCREGEALEENVEQLVNKLDVQLLQ